MEKAIPSSRYSRVDLNQLIIAIISGLVAGIGAGIISRFSMRFVAIAADLETSFTVSGTLFILILGAVAGIIFALLFWVLSFFIRGNIILRGLSYGLVLAVLLVFLPFLNAPDGELTLVSPAVGIALFAPIPIAYGLILGILINRFSAYDVSSRPYVQVHIGWLLLFGLGLSLLMINLNTLMSENFPLPGISRQFFLTANMSNATLLDLHSLLVVGFFIAYAILLGLIVVFGKGSARAFLTAAALLAFGAAFFGNGTAFASTMRALPIVRFLPGVVTTTGFMAFILLMYLFPDGRFKPGWTKLLSILWLLLAIAWFFGLDSPYFIAIHIWPEWLQLTMIIGAMITGIAAQYVRYHQLHNEERESHRWALIGFVATTVAFASLWAITLITPELKARVSPRLDYLVAFAFGPYLLIWLVLPATLSVYFKKLTATQPISDH